MLLFLSGDDTFRSRKRLHQLRDAFRIKFDTSGLNTILLDGATMRPAQFHEYMAAQGFLSSKRMIIVSDLLGEGKADVQDAVLSVLQENNDHTDNILIFWEAGEVKETTKRKAGTQSAVALRSFLTENAKNELFPLLSAAEVERWIVKEVPLRGGIMDRKAVALLAASVGSDLWRADRELEKLLHFRSGQLITVEDVEQMTATPLEDTIFKLTDALGQRDIATAVRLLEEQFQLGNDPLALLRTIAWHVRTIIGVRSLLDTGENPRTFAKTLGIHPFVAQKATKQAEYFAEADLLAIHDQLVAVDTNVKSSATNPRLLFDLLALKFRKPEAVRT